MLPYHRSPNAKSAMPYLPDTTRRELLERIYEKMTDDEKRFFVLMTLQQRSGDEIAQALAERQHRETMQVLQAQHEQISRMARQIERQNWLTDFGSDVLANFTTDGLIWLARRLFR